MTQVDRTPDIERWEKDNLCGICPYRQAVQAENERLREALKRIANQGPEYAPGWTHWCDIAQEALDAR